MKKSETNKAETNIQNPLTSDMTFPTNLYGLRQCPFCNQFPKLKTEEPMYYSNTKRLSRNFWIECDCGINFKDKNNKYFVSVMIKDNGEVDTINTVDYLIDHWNKRDF